MFVKQTRKILFLFLFHFTFLNISFAQFDEYPHPELKWQYFETEHFVIHFHQGTKRTAYIGAKIAEDIYPAVTCVYNYRPKNKIHLIFKDTDDYSNGATYFFNNKIEIWATNLDYVMRGTKNWLRDVITHEFTHMISIQKTIKTSIYFPYGFFQWFGYEKEKRKDVIRGFPNVIVNYPLSSINMPVWFAEGIAQQQNNKARYDYRDPHREMVIRDRILYNKFLTYNEMTVFGKTSHGNESSYNLGFSFSKYLVERFGEHILSDITDISSKWTSYTFNGVLEKATGVPVDTLYTQWKDSLTSVYLKRTEIIRQNEVKGTPIELEGFANLYPVYSPDGKKIAYITNKGKDYWGTDLVVYNKKTKSLKKIASAVPSSLSWSPNGKRLAYTALEITENGSKFSDLFIYDFEQKKEYRLTYNLRGKNPDFSNDGKKIAFVTTTDGLNQLNVLNLPLYLYADRSAVCAFDVETGKFHNSFTDPVNQRRVKYIPGKITQLLAFQNGRQIYHPRWSNDDSKIVFDTAVDYGRNIGVYDFKSQKFSLLLKAKEELRYPAFQKGSDWLYYSASTTGIYNLYRHNFETGKTELLTNVPGGAFMPSVAKNGDIVYACYDSVGYKIYELKNPSPIDTALAVYNPNYIKSIPVKNFDDSKIPDYVSKEYKPMFTNTMILPRIFIDYNTFKPGLYVVKSDVLDKLTFIGAAAVNSHFDYDLYAYFRFADLPKWFLPDYGPSLFAEVYNINANFKEDIVDDRGAIYKGTVDYNFNLTQFALGSHFLLGSGLKATIGYIGSFYNARIDPFVLKTETPGKEPEIQSVPIRYTYFKGHSFVAKFSYDALVRDRYTEINPSGGFYLFGRLSHESSQFLNDFDINKVLGVEVYKTYVYNTIQLDEEFYFKNPFIESHAFGLQFKGAYIDRPVDSFFHNFAGGILGMRGYPFYSIEGRHKMIGTATYRFPIDRKLDFKLGHMYFDKLYFGMFYDYGNAFSGDKINFDKFKRDAGFELRLDSFSFNMFPTKIFFQAAWPFDKARNFDEQRDQIITYPQEWRYYFGILFNFDLREQYNSLMGMNGSSLRRPKIW